MGFGFYCFKFIYRFKSLVLGSKVWDLGMGFGFWDLGFGFRV